MSLAQEYRNQLAWRDWATALATLPSLDGRLVLDLGCGVGDVAAALAARGTRVLGFDANEELLAAARARGLARAEFHGADLRALPALDELAAGIWSSFTAAYFPNLAPLLAAWAELLEPGGWIALTEVDDLFAHEPLAARSRELLAAYAREALDGGRYDFHMGTKLSTHLARAGFTVVQTRTLADREFSSDGPAAPEVVAAWRARLERLKLLRDLCGAEFDALRADFLACLAHPEHRARCRVVFCLATR